MIPGTKFGAVYQSTSGAQWLCLTGIQFTKTVGRIQNGEKHLYENSRLEYGFKKTHLYLRWSKQLTKAMSNNRDFNSLMRILIASDDTEKPWTQTGRFSTRTQPRTFKCEVAQILNPSLTKPETIETNPRPWRSKTDHLPLYTEYKILSTGEYETMLPERYIDTKDIIIAFIKLTGRPYVSCDDLNDCLRGIKTYLNKNDPSHNFRVETDLALDQIQRIADQNQSLIDYRPVGNLLSLRQIIRDTGMEPPLPTIIRTAVEDHVKTSKQERSFAFKVISLLTNRHPSDAILENLYYIATVTYKGNFQKDLKNNTVDRRRLSVIAKPADQSDRYLPTLHIPNFAGPDCSDRIVLNKDSATLTKDEIEPLVLALQNARRSLIELSLAITAMLSEANTTERSGQE